MSRTAFWIALPVIAWVLATVFFWVGYTGDDDLFYARYAYLFHRPPIVWWEFRMPAILAIRGSFLVFGPTEFAAALPSLLASLAIMASVAWMVGWPRTLTWQSQSAMLLAAVIPIDVGFRSYPGANQIAAGVLALGTACVLKGSRRIQVCGAALLAGGFMTHELSLFYVALFCLTLLAFDWRRFWQPVVWCIGFSGALVLIESTTYAFLVGDPLARLRTSAQAATTTFQSGVDRDTGIEGVRFYLWPLQNVILSKQFGFDLLIVLTTGIIAWKRLSREQRMLLVATFAVFFWLGYGSTVPWAYKPLQREFHYYSSLSLGIAVLLPYTVAYTFAHRQIVAKALVATALAVHVLTLAATGRWGANVDVSRELLRHARQHPDQQFVTDVSTMNQMYVLNGFRLPDNVVCLNGEAVEQHLLLNKEPPGTPRFHFPERRVDAALVNREQGEVREFEPEFSRLVRVHGGGRATIVPERYRQAFVPLVPVLGARGFMILTEGGDVVSMTNATKNAVTPAANIR